MKKSILVNAIVGCFLGLVVNQASAADLECWACTGTGEDSSNACGSGNKFNEAGIGVINITCASGVCAKITVETNGGKAFTRQCGSGSAGRQCAEVSGVSTCTDSCTMAFCNQSPAVHHSALSVLFTLLPIALCRLTQ